MKFIHTADLHLGRFYKGELPLEIAKIRREELWKNFENIVKYASEKNVDFLLISGDVYEREYFTLDDMNRFASIINTLENIKVFIIAGNHDYIDKNTLYNKVRFNKNIYIFKSKEYFDIDELKLRVHGISWDRDINFSKALDFEIKDDYKNILLIHGSVSGKDYFPIDLDKIKNFDYIALGHIHLREKVKENAYYPGSPEGLNFKEVGERGFLEIQLKDKLDVKFINNQIRKYNVFNIEINKKESILEINNKIKDILSSYKKDLNRIILVGEYENPKYLENSILLDSEYFYTEIINELSKSYSIEDLYLENKENIIGKVIEDLSEDKEALNIAIEALVEAQNEN